MADLWKAGPETRKLLEHVVASWHPELAAIHDRIAILMRDPASKSGGVVILGSSKKTSQREQLLSEKDYIFVLEIAAPEWLEFSDKERLALMDHLLCACGVNYDDKKDSTTYFVKKPEIQMFKAEVRRHGVWMDISDDAEDQDGTANAKDSEVVSAMERYFSGPKSGAQVVREVVEDLADSLGEGTTMTVTAPGGKSATLKGKSKKSNGKKGKDISHIADPEAAVDALE